MAVTQADLERAQRRLRRVRRAGDRLRNVRDWARKVRLHYVVKRLNAALEENRRKNRELRERIERIKDALEPEVPPVVDGGWHPDATRSQVQAGIGAYMSVPAKLVWHTTEGTSLPTYSGSHPHFTLDVRTGDLYQHVSIRSGCMALRNLSGGVETNRAHAIQVELIGFAGQTHTWGDAYYARCARLARWIEKHAGVRRACSVRFGGSGNLPPRLSGSAWYAYAGHLGHQHVPEQDHWDPGAFRIEEVI